MLSARYKFGFKHWKWLLIVLHTNLQISDNLPIIFDCYFPQKGRGVFNENEKVS
jgi:hypothetical protein